jgi:hypothetical protein
MLGKIKIEEGRGEGRKDIKGWIFVVIRMRCAV